jgi:4-amino-4-deoxy-L-arabinose transferase-like glycosyltransferase
MFQRVFLSIYERLLGTKNGAILLILLAGSFFLRFPFFFRDYVDRDESTFILMAQSLVDGYLPYTQLWDLKPPLLFILFALPISIFGKSLIVIRIVGWFTVSIISFFTYLLGKKLGDKASGIGAGIACMFLMSLGGSVQGVMSEHLSVFFLLPGLFFLTSGPTAMRYGLSGFFLALAVLCKSNLVLVMPILGLYLLYEASRKSGKHYRGPLVFLVFGGLLALFTCVFPYLLSNQFPLWWNSVIKAPLAYSEAAKGSLPSYLFYVVIIYLLWLAFRRGWLNIKSQGTRILAVTVIGLLLAFFKGGRINGHYLLQFYPIALVLIFIALRNFSPQPVRIFVGGTLLWLVILPVESYGEYITLVKNYRNTGNWYNGEGIEVPQYLAESYPEKKKVFFLEYHIGYWQLGVQPPSAVVTHPSNLCRTGLYPFIPQSHSNSEAEIQFIMDSVQPQIVIRRKGKPIFDSQFMIENAEMESYLQTYYQLDTTIGRAEVYVRR